MKLIMTRGLPGSGKSTWALAQLTGRVIRVNKDEIRIALGISRGSYKREQEAQVIDVRDKRISDGLHKGFDVIVDDTNFGRKHEPRLRQLAAKFGATFEINDSFLAIPVEECIRRDALRSVDARVGPDVIWGMAEAHLGLKKPQPVVVEPQPLPYVDDPTLPSCIICDLDGTLSLFEGLRGPFEYEKCAGDKVNEPVRSILNSFAYFGKTKIIYLSGREDKARENTEKFLTNNYCPTGPLYMRPSGDFRKDSIVKIELFDTHIRGKYNVLFVLDDRDQVVKMWRDLGLTCLQVNYGNF